MNVAARIEIALRPHILETEATEQVVADRRSIRERYARIKEQMKVIDLHSAGKQARTEFIEDVLQEANPAWNLS